MEECKSSSIQLFPPQSNFDSQTTFLVLSISNFAASVPPFGCMSSSFSTSDSAPIPPESPWSPSNLFKLSVPFCPSFNISVVDSSAPSGDKSSTDGGSNETIVNPALFESLKALTKMGQRFDYGIEKLTKIEISLLLLKFLNPEGKNIHMRACEGIAKIREGWRTINEGKDLLKSCIDDIIKHS